MNRTAFDQAIDHSCWYMRQKGGMVRREHDRVSARAFGAERGQRTARGPDGIELVNLNRLFSPACFLHDLSPSSALQQELGVVVGPGQYHLAVAGGRAAI